MITEILATEATLKTLSVSIQALVVSGKQMTLAVFRQLPETEALLDSGHLQRASYWGRVMYAIKDEGTHWVVMESGGKLYRAITPTYANIASYLSNSEFAVKKANENRDKAQKALHKGLEAENSGWHSLHPPIPDLRMKLDDATDRLADAERELEIARNYLEIARSSVETVQALPQLFIAV